MLKSILMIVLALPLSSPALAFPVAYVETATNNIFENQTSSYSAALERIHLHLPDPDDPTQFVFGYARAQSTAGMLSAQSYGQTEDAFSDGRGFAFASFWDEISISHPTLNGQPGWFEARMRVSGTLMVAAYNVAGNPSVGYGSARVEANLGYSSTIGVDTQTLSGYRDSTGIFNGSESGLLTIRIDFLYGETFQLYTNLSAEGFGSRSTSVGGSGVGIAGYGNTSLWLGIDMLFDEEDATVEGATVISASGVDYRLDFSENRVFRADFEAGLPTYP